MLPLFVDDFDIVRGFVAFFFFFVFDVVDVPVVVVATTDAFPFITSLCAKAACERLTEAIVAAIMAADNLIGEDSFSVGFFPQEGGNENRLAPCAT
jgi:hypothetical protein